MPPVKINQLLLSRLSPGARPGAVGLYERAVTRGHAGDVPGMRALFARFAVLAGKDADPEKIFRALIELRLYGRAFAVAEGLLRRKGSDRLAIKDPFIDIRFSPPPGYYAGHIRSLLRFRAGPGEERWKNYYLGALHRRLNRLDEALVFFNRAVAAGPAYGWMRFQRGWTLLNLGGDLREAEADLGAAVRSDRSDWVARCLLGEARICAGSRAEGLKELSAALKAAPQHAADITAWRGQLLLLCGDYRAALKDLLAANGERAVFSYCWLGAAWLCLGKTAKAVKLLRQAVRLLPGDAEARLWYCEALRRQGRRGAALRQLAAAGDGNWTRANKALMHAQAGRYAEAFSWYLKLDEGIRLRLEKETGLLPVDSAGLAGLMESLLKRALGNRTDKRYLYTRWLTPPRRARAPR